MSALEAQLAQQLAENKRDKNEAPWYERRYGAFQDDERCDEAMRLGAEYRRSQPTAADEIEALERAYMYTAEKQFRPGVDVDRRDASQRPTL